MGIIRPGNWEKTAAEQKGFVTSQHGILEGGCDFSAAKTRGDQSHEILQQIAKIIWGMRQKMADLSWDDDECQICIGIQIRNQWVEIDGTWYEKGSEEWMRQIANKAQKREI